MNGKPFRKALAIWLALSIAVSAASVISYSVMQQTLRQSANWPQAQMASDTALAIASGKSPVSLVSGDKADIAVIQAPFLIVYDAAGNVVSSSAKLNGADPNIPKGVLEAAAQKGEDRVSWTPAKGVRIAAVVVKVQGGPGGAVLAGRSLIETERSIDSIGKLILAAWAGCELFLVVISLIYALMTRKKT